MHDERDTLLVVGVDSSVEVLKWEMIPQREGVMPQNGMKRRKKANAGTAILLYAKMQKLHPSRSQYSHNYVIIGTYSYTFSS